MQPKRLSDAVEVKPINDAFLINSIYLHPDIADRILHDDIDQFYVEHQSVNYLAAYVDQKLVGVFMLMKRVTPRVKMDCEIHIAILKEFRRYHRLLCELCLDSVFESGFQRITLTVTDYARSMVNLALKLGFKYEGCKRHAFLKNGIFWDLHMLGMIRAEWSEKWEK